MPLTSYAVDETAVALLRLEREEARNAMNTAMLEEMLGHLAARAGGRGGPRPGDLLQRPPGPLGRRRRPRGAATTRAGCTGCSCSPTSTTSSPASRSRPSPPATARSSAAAPRSRSPATCGSAARNLRMRFPGAELGVPVGPARLVTLCGLSDRQVPAADLAQRQRRRGAADGPGPPGRPGRPHRGGGARAGAEVAAHPPEAVARLKRCSTAGTGSSSAPPTRAAARSSGSGPGPGAAATDDQRLSGRQCASTPVSSTSGARISTTLGWIGDNALRAEERERAARFSSERSRERWAPWSSRPAPPPGRLPEAAGPGR